MVWSDRDGPRRLDGPGRTWTDLDGPGRTWTDLDGPRQGGSVLASLTGLGLSAAAGLNAYIPLLLVGVIARFTDVLSLPPEYAWISGNWALGIVSVLLLAELILDKVPVVDHVNDAVATFIRPVVGGDFIAATSAAGQLDSS